ncbi:MAG: tRNA uridine-5-carboxymethylaminomethyl(34) synthesis GTPase MnmE [Acidobacteriota bacterium]
MRPAFASFDDTIAALATPPGRSALALVRISGSRAREVIASIAPDLPVPLPAREPRVSAIVDGEGETIDRAVVTLFAAPASATGEDVVEISLHGGLAVVARALDAIAKSGARPARPGEFTERAFLLGKLDLVEAEAVRELIDARTPEAAKASARRLSGRVSRRLERAREDLVRAAAELAATIDFAEDVGESVSPETPRRIAAAIDELALLAATARRGRLLNDGARVVLLGPPNAGKSTLFNALVGSDRAIVTEIPGTTRDTLDAAIDIGGIPVRLVDTAGLRETDEPIERIGVDRAREAAAGADAVVFVFDAASGWPESADAELARGPALRLAVANKIDTAGGRPAPAGALALCGLAPGAAETLREAVADLLGAGPTAEATSECLGSVRQADLVARAHGSAAEALAALARGESPEYPAAHLDEALAALADLFGETTPEEVLRRIFSTFCIGK